MDHAAYEAIAERYGGVVTINARGDVWVGGATALTRDRIVAGIADFERRLRGEARDS